MPKRVNNILDEKMRFKYMLRAYKRAAKGKRSTKEVILFNMDLASNLVKILWEIHDNKYKPGKYRTFWVSEPKRRAVMALPFRDRVVHQWYVEEFIKPVFIPTFISDTYACIEGRGTHKAVDKARKYFKEVLFQNDKFYILKCDIAKFFYSINKGILYNIIKRKIRDKKFLYLTKTIIYSDGLPVGIPIGNYTSQFFANIYLNELDHYVKEVLKVKYYVRYMDDFILFLDSKEECKEKLKHIEAFLSNELQLNLNKKTNYFKWQQGISFLGYRIFKNRISLKNDNKRKIYRKVTKWNKLYRLGKLDLKNTYQSLQSWMGHASHADTEPLVMKILKKCEWIYDENFMYEENEYE